MKKQVGPLKLWQWAAIVGGGGGLYLLLHKKAAAPGGEGEGVLSGPSGQPPLGGGGGGESSGGLSATPGPVGEPGPAGEPGAAGAPGRELTPAQAASLNSLATAMNNPPTNASSKASKPIKPNPFVNVNPRTGEHYRTGTVKGKLAHIYHSGKVVFIGSKAKATHAIHAQAKKENRSTVRVPPAKRKLTAAAVAPRSHGAPKPLAVHRPTPKAPAHHPATKPKPTPPKKKRR